MRALKTHKRNRMPLDAVYYYKQKIKKEHRLEVEKKLLMVLSENYIGWENGKRNEIFYINEATEDLERIKTILQDIAAGYDYD